MKSGLRVEGERSEGVCLPGEELYIHMSLRDYMYKLRTLRASDEVWEELKRRRKESGLSWNLFIKSLINKTNERSKNTL
jgi:hypothetical protein